MKSNRAGSVELQTVLGPTLPDVAPFLHTYSSEAKNSPFRQLAGETIGNIERWLRWQFCSSVLLDARWPQTQVSYRDLLQEILHITFAKANALSFQWQSGLDDTEISRCVFSRQLDAPPAHVQTARRMPGFPLDLFDYDNNDYIAWAFPWREA